MISLLNLLFSSLDKSLPSEKIEQPEVKAKKIIERNVFIGTLKIWFISFRIII